MLLLILAILNAHPPKERKSRFHTMSLGYQYRTMVQEEEFVSPHCSVLQYGGIFYTPNSNGSLNAFIEPNVSIIGLNQSIIQPSGSLILGFQIGDSIRVGSGPIITTRDDQDNTFFPQLMIETSFLFYVDENTIPIKIGYVPNSYGLSQYQVLMGYTWN